MPVRYTEHSAGPTTRRLGVGQVIHAPDYESMTKAELQALLEHMSLPKSGNKDELIARLRDAE